MSSQDVMKTAHYRGDKIFIMDTVPPEFGPGSIVRIDVNESDTFDHWVKASRLSVPLLRRSLPATTL